MIARALEFRCEPLGRRVGLLCRRAAAFRRALHTIFCAGVLTNARQPEAAAELIQFLASEGAAETLASTCLDPIRRR